MIDSFFAIRFGTYNQPWRQLCYLVSNKLLIVVSSLNVFNKLLGFSFFSLLRYILQHFQLKRSYKHTVIPFRLFVHTSVAFWYVCTHKELLTIKKKICILKAKPTCEYIPFALYKNDGV